MIKLVMMGLGVAIGQIDGDSQFVCRWLVHFSCYLIRRFEVAGGEPGRSCLGCRHFSKKEMKGPQSSDRGAYGASLAGSRCISLRTISFQPLNVYAEIPWRSWGIPGEALTRFPFASGSIAWPGRIVYPAASATAATIRRSFLSGVH